MASGLIANSFDLGESSTPVANADLLYEHNCLLLPNWRQAIKTTRRFETKINVTSDGSESRFGIRSRPQRTISYSGSLLGAPDVAAGEGFVRRRAECHTIDVLWPHATPLTGYAGGSNNYNGDFAPREYYVGGRVVIYDPAAQNILTPSDYVLAEVTALTSVQITLTETLTSEQETWNIAPCMEVQPEFDGKIGAVTDEVAQWKIDSLEAVRQSTLLPHTTPGTFPPDTQGYSGIPIFDFEPVPGTVKDGHEALHDSNRIGIGRAHTLHGSRARFGCEFMVECDNWTDIERMHDIFDSRAGRMYPVYVPNPLASARIIDVHPTNDEITLQADNASITDLMLASPSSIYAFKKSDGSYITFQWSSIGVAGAGQYRISSVTPGAANLVRTAFNNGEIVRSSALILCRFANDELSASWVTDSLVRFNVSFTEMLKNADINTVLQDIKDAANGPDWQPNPLPDLCDGNYCEGANCTVCLLFPLQIMTSRYIKVCPQCDRSISLGTETLEINTGVCDPVLNIVTWTQGGITVTLDLDAIANPWSHSGIDGDTYGCRDVIPECVYDPTGGDPWDCLTCGCLAGPCLCIEAEAGPNPGPINTCDAYVTYCCSCQNWVEQLRIQLSPIVPSLGICV